MTDNWAIQISPRVGDALINLRAQTGDEMLGILSWYEQNAATIASAIQGSQAGAAVAGAFPGGGTVNVQPDAATAAVQQAQSPQWGSQPQQAAPQWAAPPQQAAPAGPGGPPPQCAHGAMQFRESKPGAPKAWKAYFCPTPRGTANQCEAQWIR